MSKAHGPIGGLLQRTNDVQKIKMCQGHSLQSGAGQCVVHEMKGALSKHKPARLPKNGLSPLFVLVCGGPGKRALCELERMLLSLLDKDTETRMVN